MLSFICLKENKKSKGLNIEKDEKNCNWNISTC